MWPPRHDGAVLADTSATDARMWPPRHDGAVLADTSATDAECGRRATMAQSWRTPASRMRECGRRATMAQSWRTPPLASRSKSTRLTPAVGRFAPSGLLSCFPRVIEMIRVCAQLGRQDSNLGNMLQRHVSYHLTTPQRTLQCVCRVKVAQITNPRKSDEAG